MKQPHNLAVLFLFLTVSVAAAVPATQAEPHGGGSVAPSTARPAGSVGVVDLDAVMQGVGWNNDLRKDRETTVAEGQRAINAFNEQVTRALKERLAAVGAAAHLTPAQLAALGRLDAADMQKMPFNSDQRNEIIVYLRQAQDASNSANQQIARAVSERQNALIEIYRAAMKPSVRRVAQAKGFPLVIARNPQNDYIFYADSGIDLTNDVVDDLTRSNTRPTLPEPLTFNIPAVQFNPFGATVPAPTTRPR